MSDYETDLIHWSEHQAALLRRLMAGEQVNEAIDWPNIIEEIESSGQSQVEAVEARLYQALLHRLKAEAWPSLPYVQHWQAEMRGFLAQARRKYRPSMARKLDVAALYADAPYAMPEAIDGQPPLPAPAECPVTLESLLF